MSRVSQELSELRAVLAKRLDEVRSASATTVDDRKPVALDQTSVGRLSRMDAMQVQAMAQAVEGRRRGEGKRLEAAIARIDAGEYGYCVNCGEEIAPRRLETDPIVATCIRCAARSTS